MEPSNDNRRERRKFLDDSDEEDRLSQRAARTDSDLQRLKLARLLKNIDKLAPIPEPKKEWKPKPPPEFRRTVVGSSAGAGSGEYHIYRNTRKRELERQEYSDMLVKREVADKAYEERVTTKRNEDEQRMAKKRAKRQKRKEKLKKLKASSKKQPIKNQSSSEDESGSAESDTEAKIDLGEVVIEKESEETVPNSVDTDVCQSEPDPSLSDQTV